MKKILITIMNYTIWNKDRKIALECAAVYHLEAEVKWCMNHGYTPGEALYEWDI